MGVVAILKQYPIPTFDRFLKTYYDKEVSSGSEEMAGEIYRRCKEGRPLTSNMLESIINTDKFEVMEVLGRLCLSQEQLNILPVGTTIHFSNATDYLSIKPYNITHKSKSTGDPLIWPDGFGLWLEKIDLWNSYVWLSEENQPKH